MYESFFGLSQPPFSIAPDPRYLFMSERHREALAHLLYGLGGGGGFVLLTGEVGAGKTTVCRCFLEQVPAACRVAYIFNPKLSVIELLQSVCQEFGIAVPAGSASVKDHIDPLNAFLLQAHGQGQQCVLVIDEAQNLSADVLEQLRLLTNLETADRKLLQIILIGQPELRTQLARPELEQLAQRVIARYHLGALTEAETAAYVAHRLAVAGRPGALPFDRAALRQIHRLTGGVPRRINLLCDRALLGAYAEGRTQVGVRVVARAAAEVFDRRAAPNRRPRAVGLLAATGLLGLLGGGMAALWWGGHGAPAAARSATASLAASTATAATSAAASAASAGVAGATLAGSAAAASRAAAAASVASGGRPALPAAATAAAALPPAAASGPTVPAAAPTVAVAPLRRDTDLASLPRDEATAWRLLAAAWGAEAGPGEPCVALASRGLQCFRTAQASLALLTALDRPGLLVLRPQPKGAPLYALLSGLGPQGVWLSLADGRRGLLPLDDLAALWRGEFLTLWRPPPGYRSPLPLGAQGPAVDALAQGLARLRQLPAPAAEAVLDGALAERLAGFQLAHGLRPDAVAGPTTFMQLGRALGEPSPTLRQER